MKKKILGISMALVLGAASAMAADAENTAQDTVNTTKNPLTGTITTTKKKQRKFKHADGTLHKAEITEKTKTQKDGDTKTEVKAEESVDTKN